MTLLRYPPPLLWLAVTALVGAACGEEEGDDGDSYRRDRFVEAMRDEAEIEPPPTAAWPDDIVSLSDAVERFTTVEACLADLRARTPTGVAEGLADLSYDGFFDDVCRGLEAAHASDPTMCDTIRVATARSGCRRRVAIIAGEPDACPDDSVTDGREAVCIAWALRRAELCRAAPRGQRIRCRAVLANDAAPCVRLRRGDRQRCEAEVRRYGSDDASQEENELADAVYRLEARLGGAREATVIEREVLDRGIRLEPVDCRYRIALTRPEGEPALPLLPGPYDPTFRLRIEASPGVQTIVMPGPRATLSLALPELGPLTSITAREGEVEITAFEPERGGRIAGTFWAVLAGRGETVRVEGSFETFVRDLDRIPTACTR